MTEAMKKLITPYIKKMAEDTKLMSLFSSSSMPEEFKAVAIDIESKILLKKEFQDMLVDSNIPTAGVNTVAFLIVTLYLSEVCAYLDDINKSAKMKKVWDETLDSLYTKKGQREYVLFCKTAVIDAYTNKED